jgi:CHAD domain-containing protein
MKALHKLRIAAKKLRYTLELAGAPSDPVKDLQTRLGDINDYRAARRLLKKIPASSKPGGIAHLRDALARKQRRKVRRFRRDFKEPAPVR